MNNPLLQNNEETSSIDSNSTLDNNDSKVSSKSQKQKQKSSQQSKPELDLTSSSKDTTASQSQSHTSTTQPSKEIKDRPVRVYSDGVYDLFHFGHMLQLKQAKEAFPNVQLIVGVSDQEAVEKYKGPTVMSGEERAECVRNCKYADEVVYPAPWIIDEALLDKYKIDYVMHDDAPYVTADTDDAYGLCKKLGKFKATQRTEGVSTSDLIMNVLINREYYIYKQLMRGQSRQNINVSWLREMYIRAKFGIKGVLCPRRLYKKGTQQALYERNEAAKNLEEKKAE